MCRPLRRHSFASASLFMLAGSLSMECTLRSQVLDLNGGTSTMYQSQGGSLNVRGNNYEGGVSAGTVGGRFLAGGRLAFGTASTRYVLGMEQLPLDLPTDVFTRGHRLIGLGVGIQGTRWGTAVDLFAGTTSTRYESPLVQAATADQAVVVLQMHRPVTPRLSLATEWLFSPAARSVLQTMAWKPRPALELALTAGSGAGKRYSAASMVVKKPRLDLSAAYIDAGSGFRRTGGQTDPIAEPVRENLQFALRSSSLPRFTLSGGRQNLMTLPVAPLQSGSTTPASGAAASPAITVAPGSPAMISTTSTIATIDELSAFLRAGEAGLSGSVIHSTYLRQTDLGLVASINLPVTHQVTAGVSYFESRLMGTTTPQPPVRFGLGHIQEVLTNRWTTTQTVTVAGGQATVGFGGTFVSNLATISTDYETFYLPTRPASPFQQSLVLDVRVNLFGRLQFHAGSFLSPQGKLMYTADAHGVVARRGTFLPTVEQANLYRYSVVGDVRDTVGDPVEGAAIQIEGHVLFTDSSGRFTYREKRPAVHGLVVLVDQFLDGQAYVVLAKPETVASSDATLHKPLVIVVAQRKERGLREGKVMPHDDQKR